MMLNKYLETDDHRVGLNPLGPIGDSRSIQLALKLQFWRVANLLLKRVTPLTPFG